MSDNRTVDRIWDDVTVVLTSCGRWDLLVATLDSFLAHHRPGRFVIVEDSGDEDFAARIAARYPAIEVLLNKPQLGQLAAIDRAYAAVVTRFVMHLEDDWAFDGAADLATAMRLLEERSDVSAVCFRRLSTLKLTHRLFARRFEFGGDRFADMRKAHRDWHGYSFNPTLVRLATWKEVGPFVPYRTERTLSRHMRDAGCHVVYALPGVCGHIGSGRSVFDPSR